MMFVFPCLTFLSIVASMSTHAAANDNISSFFMANILLYILYIYIYTYHISIYLSVLGYLVCFHTLGRVNSVAMNIEIHTPFQISVFNFFI